MAKDTPPQKKKKIAQQRISAENMHNEPANERVKENKIRRRPGTFKIPSGSQSSSHDTKLAFMARSNYQEKS